MQKKLVPFITFSVLLGFACYTEYIELRLTPYFFIFVSLLYVFYFFLAITKQPLTLISVNIILILGYHVAFLPEINVFLVVVLVFFALYGLFLLSVNLYRILACMIAVAIWLLMFYYQSLRMEWFFLTLLLILSFLKLNELLVTQGEKQDAYEKIVSEYRVLKRQSLEAERAARLEERTKIARDIHDSVGHKLTALLMRLQMLNMQEKRQEYEELKDLANTSLEETRQAVKQLQVDDHEGLASVLQLIRKLESESHIHLDFTLRKGVLLAPLTNDQNVALYRVLQESLTNAMRHAHSREVEVVLELDAVGNLTFTVKNNIHNLAKFEWGFGLTNMKKRLEEINGELHVYQNMNEFVVTGTIPLEGDSRGL